MSKLNIMYICKEKLSNNRGFTLIELSIVIVIIGILVAGVVTGRVVIEKAKFYKIFKEVETQKIAVLTFQEIYNYDPGDLPNACAVGEVGGLLNYECTIEYNGTNVYLTNGDGMVAGWQEQFRVLADLSQANLINGEYKDYNGIRGNVVNKNVIGTSYSNSAVYLPLLKIDANQKAYIQLGRELAEGNDATEYDNYLFSVKQISDLVIKYDNGNIATGTITGISYKAGEDIENCTVDQYNSSSKNCNLKFNVE